jgi:hypothetical protein
MRQWNTPEGVLVELRKPEHPKARRGPVQQIGEALGSLSSRREHDEIGAGCRDDLRQFRRGAENEVTRVGLFAHVVDDSEEPKPRADAARELANQIAATLALSDEQKSSLGRDIARYDRLSRRRQREDRARERV